MPESAHGAHPLTHGLKLSPHMGDTAGATQPPTHSQFMPQSSSYPMSHSHHVGSYAAMDLLRRREHMPLGHDPQSSSMFAPSSTGFHSSHDPSSSHSLFPGLHESHQGHHSHMNGQMRLGLGHEMYPRADQFNQMAPTRPDPYAPHNSYNYPMTHPMNVGAPGAFFR